MRFKWLQPLIVAMVFVLLIQPAEATISSSPTYTGLTAYGDPTDQVFDEQESVAWTSASGGVYANYTQAYINVTSGTLNCMLGGDTGENSPIDQNVYATENYDYGNTPQYPTVYLDRTVYWISGSPYDYVDFRHKFSWVSDPGTQCVGQSQYEFGGVVGELLSNGTWNWSGVPGYGS